MIFFIIVKKNEKISNQDLKKDDVTYSKSWVIA